MKEKEPEIDAGPAAKKRRHGFKNLKILYDFHKQPMMIKPIKDFI